MYKTWCHGVKTEERGSDGGSQVGSRDSLRHVRAVSVLLKHLLSGCITVVDNSTQSKAMTHAISYCLCKDTILSTVAGNAGLRQTKLTSLQHAVKKNIPTLTMSDSSSHQM